MADEPPCIILTLGQKEILTHATTAYAKATLERLLPALCMPDPEAFELGGRGTLRDSNVGRHVMGCRG